MEPWLEYTIRNFNILPSYMDNMLAYRQSKHAVFTSVVHFGRSPLKNEIVESFDPNTIRPRTNITAVSCPPPLRPRRISKIRRAFKSGALFKNTQCPNL